MARFRRIGGSGSNHLRICKSYKFWKIKAKLAAGGRRAGDLFLKIARGVLCNAVKGWREYTVYALETRSNLRQSRIIESKLALFRTRRGKIFVKEAFSLWVGRVMRWVEKRVELERWEEVGEDGRMRRAVVKLRGNGERGKKRKKGIAFLKIYRMRGLGGVFRGWAEVVEVERERRGKERKRRAIDWWKDAVGNGKSLVEVASRKFLLCNKRRIEKFFNLWAARTRLICAGIARFCNLVELEHFRVAFGRMKKGVNLVGGMKLAKIAEKVSRRMMLNWGIKRMKMVVVFCRGVFKVGSWAERNKLVNGWKRWEEVFKREIGEEIAVKAAVRRWRRRTMLNIEEHEEHRKRRARKRAIVKWESWCMSQVKRRRRGIFNSEQIARFKFGKRGKKLERLFGVWARFVRGRYLKRARVERAVLFWEERVVKFALGMLEISAKERVKRREDEVVASFFRTRELVRKCWLSLKSECFLVEVEVEVEGEVEVDKNEEELSAEELVTPKLVKLGVRALDYSDL